MTPPKKPGKTPARKAPAKRAPAKKAVRRAAPAKKSAPRRKSGSGDGVLARWGRRLMLLARPRVGGHFKQFSDQADQALNVSARIAGCSAP